MFSLQKISVLVWSAIAVLSLFNIDYSSLTDLSKNGLTLLFLIAAIFFLIRPLLSK